MIRDKLLTITGDGDLYIGEREFTSGGTYQFTVPLAVRRIHACCIGAGAGYEDGVSRGGAGGGLAWANDIEVNPGETLTVKVGATGPQGGESGIYRGGTMLIRATGGQNDYDHSGGTYYFGAGISGGGGQGGQGGAGRYSSGQYLFVGGGGGAGGYTGNGGNGNAGIPGQNSGAGSGGDRKHMSSGVTYGTFGGGYGGGVGIRGRGATGSALTPITDGEARNGNPGSGGSGQTFGGGGSYGVSGGSGAVRIIWGITYSYPDNADVTK